MMYSATLLASLLASAHGFAAIPDEVECSANEQKFFVYSIDPSMIYPFVALVGGPDFTDNESVTHGLVGKTWQGVQLSITQGDTTITQAGGKPLTVTSKVCKMAKKNVLSCKAKKAKKATTFDLNKLIGFNGKKISLLIMNDLNKNFLNIF